MLSLLHELRVDGMQRTSFTFKLEQCFSSQNENKEFLERHWPLTLRADVSSNWHLRLHKDRWSSHLWELQTFRMLIEFLPELISALWLRVLNVNL